MSNGVLIENWRDGQVVYPIDPLLTLQERIKKQREIRNKLRYAAALHGLKLSVTTGMVDGGTWAHTARVVDACALPPDGVE